MIFKQIDKHLLINGDCLEAMDFLISRGVKVDTVITSPPYNMNLRVHSGKYMSRCNWKNHNQEFSSKYDNYSDDMPMQDYFEFLKSFLNKALCLSNLIFINVQFLTGNKVALCKFLGYFADYFKEIIIWDKIHAQPAMAERTLNSQFETIMVFEKEKPYNRQFSEAYFDRGTLSNLWKIKRERNMFHKAAFPTELVMKILNNFSDENTLVLDPFAGSFTTGLVCQNTNRRFIGIELDEKYFNIGYERMLKNSN